MTVTPIKPSGSPPEIEFENVARCLELLNVSIDCNLALADLIKHGQPDEHPEAIMALLKAQGTANSGMNNLLHGSGEDGNAPRSGRADDKGGPQP